MSADVNIKTIEAVYDAFSRGDVAAIQEVVTDDVDWASETTSTVAPWYGVQAGQGRRRRVLRRVRRCDGGRRSSRRSRSPRMTTRC